MASNGAKALLLTVLGEFVLPTGGSAWTSTLVAALASLGIGEKNARQAIARTADQELITSTRHGRAVRWSLTAEGRHLLEGGTERIYGFGQPTNEWDGNWLMAHCQVAESQRTQRDRLRTQLGFLGFGELSPSLFVSPHAHRADQVLDVLHELGLDDRSVVIAGSMATPDADVVAAAWNLAELDAQYQGFIEQYAVNRPASAEDSFVATVRLVHDWRRFPSIDPELPAVLLPVGWAGASAASAFDAHHRNWSTLAREWFERLETPSGS